ncbi:MFS transporter [Solihabitans fulvus]|nr:MFS transporter [Solihabitans fulvus]
MTIPDVRPAILTRRMALLLLASFAAMTSFYLLLSVVPLYAATAGAGGVGAGLATGVMMLATVLVELGTPRLIGRFGYRAVLAAGLTLLGLPAAALAASQALPFVLVVCLARGAGLAAVVVGGTALVAELVPAERRAEGLGLYGLAVGIPATVGLPLGVWLSDHLGFRPVFGLAAVVALVALAAVPGLPSRGGQADHDERAAPGGVLGVLRTGAIARPALVFAAVTLAAGVVVTFLPLALSPSARQLAAAALLVEASAAPLARWGAGRFGDRHGSGRLLLPAVLAAAVGTAALVLVDNPVALLAGMALFGLGFGAAQNVTLALMFDRASKAEFGRVSALWNLAFDGGIGVGAVGFGLLVGPAGYPVGFAVTAAVLFAAALPSLWDRRTAG